MNITGFRQFGSALFTVLLLAGPFCAGPARADAGFQKWIQDFKSVAVSKGISGSVYDRAFQGITSPDPEVLEKARFQPEFRDEAWQYIDGRVHERSVEKGREMARKYSRVLNSIERSTGVSANILLAIWSMESDYGEFLNRSDRLHYVPQALATLAYADRKRASYARSQLIGALKIMQSGKIGRNDLLGSWAGAMGHTQFIPTSYLAYAVDGDGDGRKDIWNSVPDALWTAANLLKRNGWQAGQTWGYEVVLPKGRKFPGGSMSLSQWESIGVHRVGGKEFPRSGQSAVLKVLQGRDGPSFLMVKNFFVLKNYNNADKYALAVGLLADQIGGASPPQKDWSRPFTKLTYSESEELQKRLKSAGFYDGVIDGKIGPASRSAILSYQSEYGLEKNGYASKELLQALRGG